MKKTALLLSAIIALTFFSCKKEYRFYGFDIEETISVNIPKDSINFNTEESIDIYFDNILEEKGSSAELVESISFEDITLSEGDYLKINEAEFHISAEGMDKLLVAAESDSTFQTFGYTGFVYKIPGINEHVTDYVKKSKINFFVEGDLLTAQEDDISLEFTFRFRVFTYVK